MFTREKTPPAPSVLCPHCCGHGRLSHKCDTSSLLILHTVTDTPARWTVIGRCTVCGSLRKVYVRYNKNGCFKHEIWFSPGERRGAQEFAFSELRDVAFDLNPHDLLELPYVELLKYAPFNILCKLRQELETRRPSLSKDYVDA